MFLKTYKSWNINFQCMLWIVNWNWLAMECSVNYTIWCSFTVWPHESSGELGSCSERTSDYDIIYRTLHGKPILVNYPFYPIDCFWFLNFNLQCQNCLFSPMPLHWYFRIATKQNQTVMTIPRSSYFGKIYIRVFPVSWPPVYWMMSSCPCVHLGVMVTVT